MSKIFTNYNPLRLFQSLSIIIAILVIIAFPTKDAKASHVMGSDITWKCIGPLKFEVTLAFYRDCRGIPFAGSKTIQFSCTRGSASTSYSITLPNVSMRDITPSCADVKNPCNPPNTTSGDGTEEHLYTGVIDFSTGNLAKMISEGCCRFKMSFGECCRNGYITTIIPGDYTTDAEIDICNIKNSWKKDCDDSPDLRNPPIGYLCCNQEFYFNNGVVDVDGDSLSFSLVMSQASSGTSVSYKSPFTPTWPMTGYCRKTTPCSCRPGSKTRTTEGICFDPETGDLSFNPVDCDECGILCIKIDQFRMDANADKWLYIGYTKRDLQLRVVTCGNNNPPMLKDITNPTVCEGDKICMTLTAEDEEFSGSSGSQPWKDTIDLSWNNGLPGATFKVGVPYFTFQNGVTTAVRDVEICWQTKVGDGREAPYLFTVTARDKACPRNALTSRGYSVRVKRRAYAERKLIEGDCGKWKLESIPEDTFWYKGSYQHQWEIRDSTNSGVPIFRSLKQKDSLQFVQGGKYIITYTINNPPLNCPSEYSDTIIVPELLRAIVPADTFVCEGDTVQIPLKIMYGTGPFKVQWDNPLKTKNPKDSLMFLRVGTNTDRNVSANVTDAKGCLSSDTTFILAVPNPRPDLGPDQRICSYDTLFLSSNYKDDGNYKFYWSRSQINGDSLHDIWLNTPGKIVHNVIDTLGCWGTDTMELFVNEKVIADAGGDKFICIRSNYPINNDTLKFVAGRTPTKYPGSFRWSKLSDLGNATISSDSVFSQSYPSVDSIFYELYVTVTQSDVTCVNADTINIRILPLPIITFKPMDPKCFDYGRINLKSPAGPDAKPDWVKFSHKKPGIVNSGLFFETDSFPDGTKPFEWVRADGQDVFGCYNIDSFKVVINPNPKIALDSGMFCQNADFGDWVPSAPKGSLVSIIPLMRENGVIKQLSSGAKPVWRILDAPPLISPANYDNLLVPFGSNPDNRALDAGPVGNKNKLGWYKVELCATNMLTNCQSCDTTFIEIVELPHIEFTTIPNQCVNFDTLNLNNYVNLKNGRWFTKSGPPNYQQWVADSSKFLPFKGPGFFDLKFVHTASGCYVADSTTINVSSLPVVRLDTFSLICNTAGNRPLKSIIPANPGADGKWFGFGVKNSGNDYYFDPAESPATKQYEGPYELSFKYTHPITGCANADTFKVRVQSQPELNISNPKPFEQCEFIPFELKSIMKFANSITWTHDGDGSFNDNKALEPIYTHGTTDTTTGQVFVRVETDAVGVCPQVRDSILLLIRPYPQFDFSGTPLQGCQPLTVDFQSTLLKPKDGDVTYFWELDSQIRTSTDPNPSGIVYKDAGDYNVKLVVKNNKAGCESDSIRLDYVNVYPNPKAAFKTTPSYFTTVAIPRFRMKNLSAIEFGSMNYVWDFGVGNNEDTSTKTNPEFFYPQDTASYLIKLWVTSDKGCKDSTEQWVKIGPDVTVYIPNAFSPNGSGPHLNNRFFVIAQGIIAFDVKLFNRWGEKLYESNDLNEGWDGKFNGVDCKQDVYTYLVKVTGFDGKDYEYKGT
ncbi:MAG: gliding motility-associated C-terminal domain-containing protein, partial [Bacteroidia bacterium]|nr:gliding motility-associated C-terminal domain-containing protein [Bacteroidia bacterium]